MGQRSIVVGGLLALVAGTAWFALAAMTAVPAPGDDASGVGADMPRKGGVGDIEGPPVDRAPAERIAASGDDPVRRPLPAHATWVDVLVVDGASGAPVAGAEVFWTDEGATDFRAGVVGRARADEEASDAIPIEDEAMRAGWRTRSDAAGRARLAVGASLAAAACHGSLYGELRIRANTVTPTGGHRIVLAPDRSVDVRVLGADGVGRGDVPIALSVRDSAGGLAVGHGLDRPVARTRADGHARLRHVQVLADQRASYLANGGDPMCAAFIHVALPGCESVRARIDLDAPPDLVELRLPPTGSLRVRAEFLGAPLPDFRAATLDPAPAEADWRHFRETARQHALVDEAGVAWFDHVPVGGDWRVGSDTALGLEDDVAGPLVAGQVVDVVLAQLSEHACVVRGRALLADGSPLRHADIVLHTQSTKLHWVEARTGEDGGFVAALGNVFAPSVTPELAIDWRPEGAPMRRGAVRALHLRAGVIELGDVRLGEPPVMLRGRITRDGDPYAGPCRIVAMREHVVAGHLPTWGNVHDAHGFVDAAGDLVVHGTITADRHLLRVFAPRTRQDAAIFFVPGAADVLVDLSSAYDLAARVRTPIGASPYSIAAWLVPLAASGQPSTDADQWLAAELEHGSDARIDARWERVRRGRYEMRLCLDAAEAPVHVIEDVLVPPPPGGDPRLADIDLRPTTRVVTLTLCDEVGTPRTDSEGVVLAGSRPAAGPWRGIAFGWPEPSLLLPSGPYDLLVCERGSRPCSVRGDASEVSVRLEAWPTVTVRLADAPPLDGVARVIARLDPIAPAVGADVWQAQSQRGELADLLQPRRRAVRCEDGVVQLPIGDGACVLSLRLEAIARSSGAAARTALLAGVQPATILPSMRTVEVRAPAAAWQAAIAAVTGGATSSAAGEMPGGAGR